MATTHRVLAQCFRGGRALLGHQLPRRWPQRLAMAPVQRHMSAVNVTEAAGRIRPAHLPEGETLAHQRAPLSADVFAVVELSGTQYKVTPDTVLCTQKLAGAPGDELVLDRVLLVADRDRTVIGRPYVEGAKVRATIEEHSLMDKIIVFKKKRRKGYRRWRGHRQPVTVIQVTRIDAVQLQSS